MYSTLWCILLAILGDIHGSHFALQAKHDQAVAAGAVALIQVGDFGFYKECLHHFGRLKLEIPVYAIDGNHEDYRLLRGITEVTEFVKNVFYVPRGTVLTLDNRRIGFLGGAGSVDRAWRKPEISWFADEAITDEQVIALCASSGESNQLLYRLMPLDLLVTHCPPQFITQKHFDPRTLLYFELPPTWRDPSMDRVEEAWNQVGRPPLVCGHMHKSVYDAESRVRILDINECITY